MEAKKPSVLIKDDVQPAYQVRRYGWSAKLNVSIITDFEEFSIYDCTKKPNPTDKTSVARVKYITFGDYEKEWDFLWSTFSKEAVLKGSFDQFIGGNANKKGTTTVDKEFLSSLDEWRTSLAETINKENKQLDEDELNFVVQQTLDRIIFLRICEDRSIEPYGQLQECVKRGDYYKNLLLEFKQADDKYNSGLFNFKKDKLSHQLAINNKTLKTIINQLYYPECPYAFKVLSVEILGSAYEQFLGKTITINNRGKAVVEPKPEVRKAGGVYYTPQYIVDYIVTNTIGKLCENRTPTQVAEIKIVDPACGSGSFLLGAYQYLLNWHKDYYLKNPNKKNPITPEGNLTTSEKKKILLNNIYGVDIDTNAAEVTKLSLLLKCMEGETQASIAHQIKMFNERVLPTLEENIKSGNSLIDTDCYDPEFDFGEDGKFKPFSWQKAYPAIFKNGGFDAVIGNPPWITMKGKENMNVSDCEINYYQKKFINSSEYKINSYALFIEQSCTILNSKGLLGFIIPSTIQDIKYNTKIRKFLIEKTHLKTIVDLGSKVFENVVAESMILILSKHLKNNSITEIYYDVKNLTNKKYVLNTLQQSIFLLNEDYKFLIKNDAISTSLLKKIEANCNLLSQYIKVYVGIVTGDNKKFISNSKQSKSHKELITGKDISRYSLQFNEKYVLFDKKELHSNTDEKVYNLPEKILLRKTGNTIVCSFDDNQYYTEQTIYNLYLKDNIKKDLKWILGILNSKLINYYFNKKLITNADAFPYIKGIHIEILPIPKISKYELDSQIIISVNELLLLNKTLRKTNLESKQEQIKQKIDYHEDKINSLVYQLYDLTEAEIKLIETY